VKFLENAKKFISDSRQKFDVLPESSKSSVKNIVFASHYIPDKDIHDFAVLLKRYYRDSEEVQNAHKSEDVDPELRKECMILKNQAIPDAQLIDYYIQFMRRHNSEPICGNFGKQSQQAQQPQYSYFQAKNFRGGNNFGPGGGNNFGPGGGNNFGPGGGYGGPNGGQAQQWQGQPGQYQPQQQQFPGIAGLQQGQQPNAYQANPNNPFENPSQPPPQQYAPPAPVQGKVEHQMQPGFQNQQAPTYGNAYPVSGGGYNQGPSPFDNPQGYNAYANAQNPNQVQGQPQAPVPNSNDDFMSQLEDLKLGKK
jgi:hypothetical protein